MEYLIDIVGTCNLKCPSCPVGNVSNVDFAGMARPKGFMKFELFEQIIAKARHDSAGRGEPIRVFLYNWGEALIHPRIVDFVQLLSREQIPFHISSNMNNDAPLKQIVRAGPAGFRISLSGFSQDTYGTNHVGGDANLVIGNMYRLRHAMDHCKSKMPVEIFYHVYRDNCDDDLLRMADLSQSLGFYFHPGWAYFQNFDKYMTYLDGTPNFSPADQAVIDRLVLGLDEMIALAREQKSPSCHLQTHQTVINHDGSVALCCAVYDPVYFVASDFRSVPDRELQQRRRDAPTCTKCMGHGFHDLGMYLPNDLWDAMANRRQVELGQRVTTTMFSQPHVHLRQETKVEKIRQRISKMIPIRAR
jgi:MoaA/NifB/PqqE/SkfB family radical SAM enzyme